MKLRDYQNTAVERIRDSYRKGSRSPLLVLPTGGGKTIVFTFIARSMAESGKSVLILVHRQELLRQTSEKLSMMGVAHGIIHRSEKPAYYKEVQVAMVQTVVKRLDYLRTPDLIIIDEAHHAPAGSWNKVLDAFPDAFKLGVTATPMRMDGKGLAAMFDDLVEGPSVQELIDGGYLVEPVCYSVPSVDMSGVRSVRGDYDKKQTGERVDKPKIIGDVIAHYRKYADGAPAVVFCVSVAHAEHVAREFRVQGYKAYAVDGGTDDETRKRLLGGLENGTTEVLCTCDLVSEGTDIPAIGAAILLRPTKSEALFIQQVGRALRPSEGKEHAVILDHVGNIRQHGLPTEAREWVLTEDKVSGKRLKSEPTLRVQMCSKCYAAFSPSPVCPSCGTEMEMKRKPPKEVAGELQRIEKREKRQEVGRARSIDDLRQIAKERGYKAGWVWRMAQLKGLS